MVLMRIKKRLKRESDEQETSRSISRENEISPVRREERALDRECACWRLAICEEHSAREVRVSRADWRAEQASVLSRVGASQSVRNTQHVRCESAGLTGEQNKLLCSAQKGCVTEQCGGDANGNVRGLLGARKGARSPCVRYDEVPTWPARYGSRSGGSGISHRQAPPMWTENKI
jgi:hypothetical protein